MKRVRCGSSFRPLSGKYVSKQVLMVADTYGHSAFRPLSGKYVSKPLPLAALEMTAFSRRFAAEKEISNKLSFK